LGDFRRGPLGLPIVSSCCRQRKGQWGCQCGCHWQCGRGACACHCQWLDGSSSTWTSDTLATFWADVGRATLVRPVIVSIWRRNSAGGSMCGVGWAGPGLGPPAPHFGSNAGPECPTTQHLLFSMFFPLQCQRLPCPFPPIRSPHMVALDAAVAADRGRGRRAIHALGLDGGGRWQRCNVHFSWAGHMCASGEVRHWRLHRGAAGGRTQRTSQAGSHRRTDSDGPLP